jgi:hypothetical protein
VELLVGSAKGLANFEMVKKSVEKNIYERSKRCPKHWTMLRFILELLTLKAKHSWSDSSFNDLLRMLAWLLPKPNKISADTYRAKKLVSLFMMGVNTFKDLDKCLVCSASRYKNNAGYCGGDNQGAADGNKSKRKDGRNSVAFVEPADTTLGIFEKQGRIPVMVMWYIPVANCLRCYFSNPKDVELMQWWDSDKRKKGDVKLRHLANAHQWKKFNEK